MNHQLSNEFVGLSFDIVVITIVIMIVSLRDYVCDKAAVVTLIMNNNANQSF